MRRIKLVAVAVLAASLVTVVSGPALASSDPIPGVTFTGPRVKGSGTATPLAPINTEQQLVQFSCRAVSTGGAVTSTSVDFCQLIVDDGAETFEAGAITLPGYAANTIPVVVATRLGATLKVCWGASARPTFGPAVYDNSRDRCTRINTIVAA